MGLAQVLLEVVEPRPAEPAPVEAADVVAAREEEAAPLGIEEVPAIPLYQQIDLYGANKRISWKARSDELIRAYDMSLK